ncbi:hypothetical protein [Planctomycetes bacterium Poly30]|uniref:hypothetical protein n=1 Tax=Saltatorellus ferox TaxID=2528018 RepID=UPI0011A06C02
MTSAPQTTSSEEGPIASTLGDLERRLRELSGEAETLEITERNSRLARIERDLCALQCESVRASGTREHPVLGVALGWEERLRRAGSTEAADEVEHIGAEILIHGLRERERTALDVQEQPESELVGAPGAEARDRLFLALLAVEELRQRVEGRATALGISNHADLRAVCEEAGRVQRVIRKAFKKTLESSPPGSETRRVWTGRLVDLADETIIRAGERDARIAARQLSETGRAVEWHLDSVETRSGEQRRRLRRRMRRLDAERIEQHLLARLEKKFGKRFVELWDRAILVGLAAVMLVLAIDLMHASTPLWLLWIDTAICGFFLVDFFVKAGLVGFHPTWLKRHVFTDLIPAIPFAFIPGLGPETVVAGGAALDAPVEGGRFMRLLRLLRAVKIIRIFRAVSFLVRGLDRLVRQNARLLEGEVLLFPTPDERRVRRSTKVSTEARLWRLRGSLDTLFEHLYEHAGGEERARLEQLRASALRDASRAVVPISDQMTEATVRRESLPLADDWLGRLSVVRSEEVEGRVGGDAVQKIASGARLIARSPLRILPLLRGWAPSDAADLPDRRVASRTIRAVSRSLGRFHRRVLWWADLRGTLTPGELVGRVGSTLVARTARPAVRLLMFGGLYLLLKLAILVFGDGTGAGDAADPEGVIGFLEKVAGSIWKIVGGALAILGSICLAILAFGVWLQRLAQDATTFHEQVARAQFLHLTDSIKARQREADAELLGERVFRLERNLFEAHGAAEATERDVARFVRHLHQFLAEGISPPSRDDGFDPVARAVMLHRDLLDGALLAESDTRATSQLLGNLALQRLVGQSKRISKAMRKRILKIDLERRRTFVRGPYLWFHSISRALSSRSARLIVDYNGHAIPLSELELALPYERARYESWLAGGRSTRDEALGESGEEDDMRLVTEAPEITTAFTVLHFLDDSPARDAEVAARFGERVVEKMREDRRALVRTVFGTYPLHRLPRESRVLNLRTLYSEWVEGGRVLLIPLRLAGIVVRLSGKGVKAVGRAVAAIRRPELYLEQDREVEADFHAAARKIGRMRGPGAQVALYLRAVLDPEYHGIALPFGLHDAEEFDRRALSACQRDAAFLDADPEFLDVLAALEARAQRNVGRLERAAKGGLVERLSERLGKDLAGDPTGLRALTVLVHADDRGIRAKLFGLDVLCETAIDALEFGLPKTGLFPPVPLWLSYETWWSREGGEQRVLEAVKVSGVLSVTGDEADVLSERELKRRQKKTEQRIKRALWRALQADVDGAREALAAVRAAHAHPSGATGARAAAEEDLAAALRHPARVTEQLVTLRAIQTLTLVDVRNYRRHIWSLGEFEKSEDPGSVLLDLDPRELESDSDEAEISSRRQEDLSGLS